MNLQKQLRRLEILAGDRDRAGVLDALTELGRHSGWSRDVEDAIAHMGAKQRTFVQHVIDSQQPARGDVPGPGDQAGGKVSNNQYWSTSPMSGVTRDATSLIYAPANASEAATWLSAAGIGSGGPSSLWNCQDASGNAADAIDTEPLVANGAVTYQGAVSGWSRLALGIPQATSARFALAAAHGPNPSSTSVLWIGYIDITAQAAATRGLMTAGGAAAATAVEAMLLSTTHFPRLNVVSVTTDGAADPLAGGVRPFILQYDRTNNVANFYNDLEKIVGTYNAGATDGVKGFGATTTGTISAALSLLWGCVFSGPAAELSDAQIKTALQTLGWTIPW